MSMPASPGYNPPPVQTAGATDVVTQLQGVVRQLGAWVTAFAGRQTFGTFAFPAAATVTVNEAAVKSNSFIALRPTNASAGTLVGSANSPYVSAISPGVSFTVATASTSNAAGTETFSYLITTPS